MQGLPDAQDASWPRNRPCAWIDDAAERMFPLARLSAQRDAFRQEFASGSPYPHVVMDGLFDEEVLDRVIEDFPQAGMRDWITWDTQHEIKQTSRGIANLSPFTQLLFLQLCSEPFLEELRYVTGIPDLIWDPVFHGAGLHESFRGGWLNVHADWTRHPVLPLTRRLNLIIYLNREWPGEWGGDLELVDPDTLETGASVAPVFNRAVLFPTTARTPHGFPRPLACPVDRTRKSISVFYWTLDREAAKEAGHINFLPGLATTRARAFARSFVPPVLFEAARSIRSRLGGG